MKRDFMEPLQIAVLFVLVILGVRYVVCKKRGEGRAGLPPGPRPWPIVGNLLHVGTVPHEGMMKLTQKYGPLVYLRLGSIPHVVTDDPDMVTQFVKIQDHVFASRPTNVILAELLTYGGKDIGFAPYGSHWRMMRKICTLQLFSPKRLESFEHLRREEVKHVMNIIWQASQDGKCVNLREIFTTLTSNMMTKMLLGKRYFGAGNAGPQEAEEVRKMISEGILMMNGFNISDYLPFLRFLDIQGQERRMKQIMKRVDAIASALLKENIEQKKPGDGEYNFADILVSMRGENGEERLSEDIIKAVFMDMMAAGTDTPAVSTEWAMSELLRDPALLNKVREEVDSVVGLERNVEESDFANLHCLRAVLKESFRLHPVGAILIPHLAMADATVAGYYIPKNTRVLLNVFSLNRNPKVWKDPEEFRPERFWNDRPVEFIDSECKLIPFGGGRRMCPAASLGSTMVLLGLAHFIHAFDWTTAAPIQMHRAPGTMVRAQPLYATPRPRLPPHFYSP